jgi:hypothetical protein
MPSRGCVFFNFGSVYTLRLLVALHSLRKHYGGPAAVILVEDEFTQDVTAELSKLDVAVIMVGSLSKSFDRHQLFLTSPYETTLAFDSDILFQDGIDALWAETERCGLLVTRFYPAPYGLDGSPEKPGGRMGMLKAISHLVDPAIYEAAVRRITLERKDVNIGVMGVSRPRGDAFIRDLTELTERGRHENIMLLDEMLVVALLGIHEHSLADEMWNCPADEFFRQTNLRDARIIHYFAEGMSYRGITIGRRRTSWAGLKWFDAFESAAKELDLEAWVSRDPAFAE